MKKKLSAILGTLCIAAILGACVITNEAGDPCLLNYGLLAFAAICGIGSKKTEGAK